MIVNNGEGLAEAGNGIAVLAALGLEVVDYSSFAGHTKLEAAGTGIESGSVALEAVGHCSRPVPTVGTGYGGSR